MKTVVVVNLGCPKNQIDAETMLGLMARAGYEITTRLEEAEVIIVNTCGFIEQAKEESINKILEVAEHKKHGCCRQLIVSGCLSQRYQKQLPELLPEVDAYLGTGSIEDILDVVESNASRLGRPSHYAGVAETDRMFSTWPYGYLKIAEGCNNRCSYCVIPRLRGRLRSKNLEQIVNEAKRMLEAGIREIVLIAQDCSAYGLDTSGRSQLVSVLQALETLPGEFRVRVLYCYPDHINDDLIDFLSQSEKVVRYLDIPLQHSHPEILASMGRSNRNTDVEQLVGKLRERITGIALRTTFIVGYPGETETHYQHLYDFAKRMKFAQLGAFVYSRERGTRAARLPDQVPNEEKQRRYNFLMQMQQRLVQANNQSMVDSVHRVLIDYVDSRRQIAQGRGYWQAPEIDNNIVIEASSLKAGTFVDVRVNGVNGYNLRGVIG
ncbi:MAG: 30S ribosomal protein S12 methylthiotransferase RimO [Firmicutes bacterium]|nr:30S ribosomal protein S12 methylthiotransferase RimO [Bacillota bacterium]